AVVTPVGMLPADAPVVVDQPLHRLRQRHDLRCPPDLHPAAEEVIGQDAQDDRRVASQVARLVGALPGRDDQLPLVVHPDQDGRGLQSPAGPAGDEHRPVVAGNELSYLVGAHTPPFPAERTRSRTVHGRSDPRRPPQLSAGHGPPHHRSCPTICLTAPGRRPDPDRRRPGGQWTDRDPHTGAVPCASLRHKGQAREAALREGAPMEHRPLGRTGVSVSKLCLGTMMFGDWGTKDHDESIRIIHRALDAGINFIDTADAYSAGESEEIVGKALAGGRRDDIVLATKAWFPMGEDAHRRGASRRWIIREVEDSLRRLGTDWIDLYQIHRYDPDTDIEETLGALTDLVRQGKVRYLGSSTFPAFHVVESQWAAERRDYERFVCEQPPYSIFVRTIERELLPVAQRYGMGVIVWRPLAGGWVAGRERRGA